VGGAQNWLVTPSPALAGACPLAELEAPKLSGMNGTGLLALPAMVFLSCVIHVLPGPTATTAMPATTTSRDTHLTQRRLGLGCGRSPASWTAACGRWRPKWRRHQPTFSTRPP